MRDALRTAYFDVFRAPVTKPMVQVEGDPDNESFAEPSAVVEVSFGPPPSTKQAPPSGST
jgi:hypothetical protein